MQAVLVVVAYQMLAYQVQVWEAVAAAKFVLCSASAWHRIQKDGRQSLALVMDVGSALADLVMVDPSLRTLCSPDRAGLSKDAYAVAAREAQRILYLVG